MNEERGTTEKKNRVEKNVGYIPNAIGYIFIYERSAHFLNIDITKISPKLTTIK